MPSKFVEVWLQGTSYLPVPRAYIGEPYRLYVNRVRGFFHKHAPDYPPLDADLLQRAFVESRYLDKNSKQLVSQAAMSYSGSRLKPWGSSNAGKVRASQAARIQAIRRRQAQMGWRVTPVASFYPRARDPGVKNLRTGGLLGMEVKYFDTSKSASALASTTDGSGGEHNPATILCLNGVPQGDTAQSRDGFKIAMKSLYVTGNINIPTQTLQSTADIIPNLFVALVLDTQTNGGTATGIDSEAVFTNPSGNAYLGNNLLRNMSYTERFKVLKTFKWAAYNQAPGLVNDTGATGGLVQAGFNVPFELSVNLKGLQTKFQSGTTSGYVGTVVDNGLFLIAFCSSTSYVPTISYNARLRFVG